MYRDLYDKKLTTPDKAVSSIRSGSRIIHGMASAEPPALLGAIAERLNSGESRFTVFSHGVTPQIPTWRRT